MSDRRTNNSLIFLTTLGVYLGLVLVGSCPTVLAQAATTRDYDIKSEVVIEDELDKKPEDLEYDDQTLDDYFESLEGIVGRLGAVAKSHRTDFSLKTFDFQLNQVSFCENCGACGVSSTSVRPAQYLYELLESVNRGFAYSGIPADCVKMSQDGTRREIVATNVSWNGQELKLETRSNTFGPTRAALLAERINQSIAKSPDDEYFKLNTRIRLASKISSDNHQFVVVTTLPRASIDEPARN